MVRLRLMRLGRRHRPFYRLNAIDQRTRRNGKVIENLGWFNPIAPEDKQVELKVDRIKHWLSVGAQPSDTVRDMLAKHEILDEKKIAEWNAQREIDRARVTAKVAGERAAKAVEDLTEFAESAEAEVDSFLESAKAAQSEASAAVSKGDPSGADAAAGKAEQALADAKKADEAFKAKKAAEEAAAAEAEKSDEGEAEGGEGES